MNKDKALFRQEREKLLLTGEIPRLFFKYALPGVADYCSWVYNL